MKFCMANVTFLLAAACSAHSAACGHVLTSVAEASRMAESGMRGAAAFDISGTVLTSSYTPPQGTSRCFFSDATDGAEIFSNLSNQFDFAEGEKVRIKGKVTSNTEGRPHFRVDDYEKLGRGRLPAPIRASESQINGGALAYRRVTVRGVVQSIVPDDLDPGFVWLILRTDTGPVMAPARSSLFDSSAAARLVDAEVEVTGLAVPFTGWRQNLGFRVDISSSGDVSILKPQGDPFAAPVLSGRRSTHRQRAEGRVVATARDRFFMRTNSRNQLVSVQPAGDSPLPRAGESVAVSGFVETDPFRVQFLEAVVRKGSKRSTWREKPIRIDAEKLFSGDEGTERINTTLSGLVVSLRGKVSTDSEFQGHQGMLRLECGTRTICVDASAVWDDLKERPKRDYVVEATGLCIAEFENVSPGAVFPRFRRFTIVPRDAADLRIATRPPWWTPLRLAVLVAALVAVLTGLGAWSVMLKRKAERHVRALYDEKIRHALAEQKVEERTRLAVELHDSVSQTLTGVALQLDGGETDTAKTMLAACRGELRRCLWDLRSRTFEEKDLTEAIERTIAPHLNGTKATVRFNVPREMLSETTVHAVLRIVRELVVNAIRHGGAKHVRIAGECHGSTISFSVSDDGAGFDPTTAPGPKQGHFGLLGVRERLEDFDGRVSIESAPGQGAKFTVTMRAWNDYDEGQN